MRADVLENKVYHPWQNMKSCYIAFNFCFLTMCILHNFLIKVSSESFREHIKVPRSSMGHWYALLCYALTCLLGRACLWNCNSSFNLFCHKELQKKEDLTSRKNAARLVTSKVLDRLHKPRRIIARLHMREKRHDYLCYTMGKERYPHCQKSNSMTSVLHILTKGWNFHSLSGKSLKINNKN